MKHRCRRVARRQAGSSGLFGFNDFSATSGHFTPAQSAQLARRSGANVVRLTFDWRWAEPRRDEYHLERYDAMYRAYLAEGIRPLFMLLYSPSWTWDPTVWCSHDCRYPPGALYDGEWRQMAALLAKRYPRAAGFEIWNEPNLARFWKPRPDVARYTALQRSAYDAIKAVAPSMPVVSGGLNNKPDTTARDMSISDFARGMYANGAKGHMDALGIHPYPFRLDKRFFLESFANLRAIRDAAGDNGRPLWVTEFGFTTTGFGRNEGYTPAEQAAGLVDHYRAARRMPDVELVTLHTLIEPPGALGVWDLSDPDVGYGMVDRYLRPKPAFCAIARERGKPDPCARR